MALLMELARHAGSARQAGQSKAIGTVPTVIELFGKKLGIIGLGGIGQTVARHRQTLSA